MKKLVCIFVAIALSCSFVISAGAWGFDDITENDITYNQAFPLKYVSYDNGIGAVVYDTYSPGEWAYSYDVELVDVSSSTLFYISELGFEAGYGVGAIVSFGFPSEILPYIDHITVQYQQDLGTTIRDNFKCYPNGEIQHSIAGGFLGKSFFEDDLEYFVQFGSDTFELYIAGTVRYELEELWCYIYMKEGFAFNGTYTFGGFPVTFARSADSLGDAGNVGEDSPNDILSGIGQAFQGVIGWVGQVVPLVTEYPGFIMMIAVPLCVGILTWVTTIYKRRRG